MQTWMLVGRVVLLVLGVPLTLLAVVMAIFAGGEGSPAGQALFVTLMAVPVTYLVSLVASVGLSIQKKSGPALAAAAFPFLYFVLAFVLAAAWASATSP